MRILFLVGGTRYGTTPSARYRVWQYLPYFQRDGIECIVRPLKPTRYPPLWIRRLSNVPRRTINVIRLMAQLMTRLVDVADSAHFDRIFIQKDLVPIKAYPILEKFCVKSGRKTFFDFDDAIFVNAASYSFAHSLFRSFGAETKIDKIVAWSYKIIVGNNYLRDYAIQFNDNVTVIPTPIDTNLVYTQQKKYPLNATNLKPVVGWSGTYHGLSDLDEILPTLRSLRRKKDFTFRIISDKKNQFTEKLDVSGIDIDFVQWRSDSEVEDILGLDIGIMPLPDNRFTRGKCGFKALQYMACGIPAVVSPVGANSEIVKHGENGFLASSLADWDEHLFKLLEDQELRNKLGQAARFTVENHYSVNVTYPLLLSCLEM